MRFERESFFSRGVDAENFLEDKIFVKGYFCLKVFLISSAPKKFFIHPREIS